MKIKMPKGIYQRKPLSEEHKKKLSVFFKGRKSPMLGKKQSEDAKKKISRNNARFYLGKKLSSEHVNKLIESHRGIKNTPEQKKKISNALKGRMPKNFLAIQSKGWLSTKNRKWTMVSRKKASESHKGSKSHLWRGGITSENKRIRRSLEYRLWREAIFKRDNWTCVWGGKEHGTKLNADHIKPFAYYPELRFTLDNGRTLCIECHKTTENYAGRGRNKFKQNV